MRLFHALLFAAAATVLPLSAAAAEHTAQPLSEIKKQIEEGKAVLVDVREKKEWDAGHVEGAILLPLSKLQSRVTKEDLKPLPKEKTLYVHCVVGKRAVTAGKILKKYGYQVQPVKPGYKEMIEAGFPKGKE